MKEILRQHSFSITFVVVVFGYFLVFAGDDSEIQQLSGFTMGTSYQIQLVKIPAGHSWEQIAGEVNELLTELDSGMFSTYAADSELSRFNRYRVGSPFPASAEMIEVLQMAQDIAELSGGAFDITVGPLVNLWGFGPSVKVEDTVPKQQAIDALRNTIGYKFLVIDEARSEIRKIREIYVDLSAIAKGYAVDQLAEYFDALGVESYFLEIGGELKIKGLKPGEKSWIPAIETPLDTESQVYEIFFSRGEKIAVAGSGDYRNYFELDGVRYSHEIDPRSGRPISHKLAAAYVIDASAARADALATAYMILGFDAARELAESQNQAAYFIVKAEGSEFDDYVTEEFAVYLSEN